MKHFRREGDQGADVINRLRQKYAGTPYLTDFDREFQAPLKLRTGRQRSSQSQPSRNRPSITSSRSGR